MYKPLLQVTEWRLKCEAIEKRESERREVDAKKHREEVTFLENHGECLPAASMRRAALLSSGSLNAGSCFARQGGTSLRCLCWLYTCP